jgi:two-component system CheB/CheR fusion protein
LDSNVATHLYRIAQEAVSNAVRHGLAKHVRLELTTGHDSTTLTVHDDGTGLPDVFAPPTGLGLRIMRYRASMIGAAFTIQNDPGGGTRVACVWPHAQPQEDDAVTE